MATPAEITIGKLNGNWIMQRIPWLLRTALAFATLHIDIKTYETVEPETGEPATNIDFHQTTAGKLRGTTEKRTLTWKKKEHKDYFFGEVLGQSQFVGGSPDEAGHIRPEFDLQTSADDAQEIKSFLRGGNFTESRDEVGFLCEDVKGLWVHTFERSVSAGWTAEQVMRSIWGFELINKQRHFTRRIVVMNAKGRYLCVRLVYDFEQES
ncbi:hypothetical protein BDV26DRAFT_281180 [Aspergillus bertholletiae]|uniref:Calycin-like protein n=1 Tax=Aspergillus bertholletiae TaxID=1226010 RepID=A0A5N7B944_9EURO|nr:hypothetical protein BDV26DRAFT_281180 [Aspergillus bertholletiae]